MSEEDSDGSRAIVSDEAEAEAETNAEAEDAPERLFHHVELSLDNGIKSGRIVEVPRRDDPKKYWLATITLVCGHVLRVRYLGSSEDFWCDLTNESVKRSGWCDESGKSFEAPREIGDKLPKDKLSELLKTAREQSETLPEELLNDRGASAFEKIKSGMKLEIRSEKNPYKYWIATIIENSGGRLKLRYDAPRDVVNDFYLFYTSSRIRHVGFCTDKRGPYQYQYPKQNSYNKFDLVDWGTCLSSSNQVNESNPFPKSVLPEILNPSPHNFEVGMKLEAINPSNMSEICTAYVAKVFDNLHFLVVIENSGGNKNFWLGHSAFPYIFPTGWAESNGLEISPPPQWKSDNRFNWKSYLESTSTVAAPHEYFVEPIDAYATGFRIGMKLEAVDPEDPANVSPARILKIVKNLLLIQIEHTKKSYWFSHDSLDLFPTGWCSSNNVKTQESNETVTEPVKRNIDISIPPGICESRSVVGIYFNYKCFSGPFISKNKLSQLPKFVGPGPVSLVIREVLNKIISVAYKPARLLKDWEYEGGESSLTVKLDTLKAKLKTSTHYAKVQVVDTREEIPSFCKEMCSKLQACPFLFGPTEITDECPERCLLVNNKTKFRKRRRRRGLHFMTIRARERRAAMENEAMSNNGIDSGNESDQSIRSTPLQSESGTRPNTPDSNSDSVKNVSVKKPRRKREPRTNIPPLEMKTRGAKLPNFALQIKEGHWNKKDVETMYNNTCVVPKKQYSDDSESDNNSNSCNSNETKNNRELESIFDVSDSEEPELKKLRDSPSNEPSYDTKSLGYSDSSASLQSLNNSEMNFALPANPSLWSVEDVYKYLSKYEDCKEIAKKLKEEEIDGIAFIMLNFPTMQEHLKMKVNTALTLCNHVATLKWTYFSKFKC